MHMLALLTFLCSLIGVGESLWPIPRQLKTGNTPLKLSRNLQIIADGDAPTIPEDLLGAISRTRQHLRSDKFERLVVGRSSADSHLIEDASELDSLILSLPHGSEMGTIASEVTKSIDSRSESYTLAVPTHGQARLISNSSLGLFRGLNTFEQLWYSKGEEKYLLSAPIEIVDEPAFVSGL